MPQDIFRDVTRPPAGLGSQAWYTVPLSILTHAAIVAILVLVPLVATDVVPMPSPGMIVMAAPPPPEPPPPPAARPSPSAPSQPAAPSNPLAAPTSAGDKIAEERPVPEALPGVPRAEGGFGAPTGVIGGLSDTVAIPAPPPVAEPKAVRAGGVVKYPEKIRDVRPIYPAIAVQARVEGRVIIEAVIGVDGRVKDARILRSIALLDRAALEAVNQWVFSPTTLNGIPVPVIITVTVDFKLQ